jgi:hypothetical protein
MPEVDPASGMPKETIESLSALNKFNRAESQKAKYNQLMEDISSEKGQFILYKIKEHLLVRVNKLMDEDGECRALKKLLIDMGVTLNLGEMAIDKLMKLVSRKQAP